MKYLLAIYLFISSSIAFAGFLDDLWESSVELVESITGQGTTEGEIEKSSAKKAQDEIVKTDSSDVGIIDHRTADNELKNPDIQFERTKEIMGFQASLNEMGAAFNCKKARDSFGRLSVFNTKMTPIAASCIAERTTAPEAFNEYLSQMAYINEWSYLTVVTGEYINQLDEATRQLFGSEFEWQEITKINPYCNQYKDVVSEVRAKRKKTPTNFESIFNKLPNHYLTAMLNELNERKLDELINGNQLKYPTESYTLVELLALHKMAKKEESSARRNKQLACKKEVGAERSCDYNYFNKQITLANKKVKNIEKTIRTRESQFPYLAQSYEQANSVTDIKNLMSFYDLHDGRENLYKLKEKYKILTAQNLSEQALHTQMKGALAPSIAAKKTQYKNFLAATCSANIPISQAKNVGLPWTALTSANDILEKVEKSNPQFEGYANCLRNASQHREKIHGTAAMAGAALCFGSAVGLGMASAGTATMIVSPLCGAAFFGLDALPKIESSKALASSISCQQLLGKKTCSDEERERIEDLDWWATFGTSAAVAGEAVGVGMDAFAYGSKAVKLIRKLPSAQKQVNAIDRLYQFHDIYKQNALADQIGEISYKKAIEFMDDIEAKPEAARFFYPDTSTDKRLAVVRKYLSDKGANPKDAEAFLSDIDEILKSKGKSLDQATMLTTTGNDELALFKLESEIAYDLSHSKYFEQLGDEAKISYLKQKYPHASDKQIGMLKAQLDNYLGNAQDPQGLLQLIKFVDEKNTEQLSSLLDPEKIQSSIERAKSLGFQGTDTELKDAILAERISALWSIKDGRNVAPEIKGKILNIINDPKVRSDIIETNKRACM